MVCNCKVNPMINREMLEFLKASNIGSMQFELLRFIGQHPRAKLSFYVIARGLGSASIELGEALMALISKDILAAQYDENGLTTYSLSADRQTCEYICELANMDWIEAMSLRRQLAEESAYR